MIMSCCIWIGFHFKIFSIFSPKSHLLTHIFFCKSQPHTPQKWQNQSKYTYNLTFIFIFLSNYLDIAIGFIHVIYFTFYQIVSRC